MKLFGLHRNKEKSDEELVSSLKINRESDSFQQLYERYIPMIYGLCLKYLKNENDAQDAVIDIYENLSSKIYDYDISNFKNWLYSVVKNHCFHILRSNKKEFIVNFDSNLMESDEIITLFDEEKDGEKEKKLNECIKKLPDPQRISVQLFFYDDKSYVDIAEQTGYSLKSVKSYIQNGKRNLKICIEKNLSR